MGTLSFLPWKGRWQAEGLTEGCPPLDSATPRRRAAARPLPFQGRIFYRAEGATPSFCASAPLREPIFLLARRREGDAS